ncbi:DEAD/DEAH box helicase [Candidatus Solirubrobacter pratensis]|uniref:DEAD/DEAH box helicase n=1 Tax=Candidatus Solirubrobacter pratensis TaxID=1298857 RepID=UPI00041D3298|nr:DEAD/DEAH box helicase [Candidatus Solirubrobacter pratensis]
MVVRSLPSTSAGSDAPEILERFHPAVRAWFTRRFPDGPTEAQAGGWPAIVAGRHTLVCAPTGSGKTLAAFLTAIDALYHAHDAGERIRGVTRVVYLSPLKALAVDVHTNLEEPLAEIAEMAREIGHEPAPISVGVRTGDSTSSERQMMIRRPPNLLVTTPESLYLYLTAERSRATLATVESVIVDEIHALARDKRGSHLALSLERLQAVTERPPVRIGLSATVKPVETAARLLVGASEPLPTVVDSGDRRRLDLSLDLPDGELEAAVSGDQFNEILDLIAAHVANHRTTLVFVNTRKLSERVAHELGERLGADQVAAHHGSLSRERRQRVEQRLRAGDLRALVATASLELGIDVGPVELVCQIGSPHGIATFVQRVGRANHQRSGVPRGIMYPSTRDDLVECAALLAAVRRGRLDSLHPPEQPLDILAQQIVAEAAARGEDGVAEDELFELVTRAAPYAGLAREEFDEIVELVSAGIETGRGRRMAYLHRDRVNRRLRSRRGARLATLTSGGAIPETGDYRVLMEPGDVLVGTVNEDFAIESYQGDVFLLGSHPWQVVQVTNGVMRVRDAAGKHPTIPFWLGEAPGRTDELSEEVSRLRSAVAGRLDAGGREAAIAVVQDASGADVVAAALIVDYLRTGRTELGGVLPTHDDIVFERCFDQTGGMQLIVHAPLGARINRALGLGLRKKFCLTFDVELQAAASNDAVLLSLGPQHSFPLEDVPVFLRSHNVQDAVSQAVLRSPMFTARWRWNLNRSLAVLRRKGGRLNPFSIQRMEAADLMAAVFPSLAACQDNTPAGPIEIPDHPLVRETLGDCLNEAMDIDGLQALVRRFEQGRIRLHFVDTVEPSVLAHEILGGAPFTYLDEDTEIGERRSRAVPLRRGLPVEPRELGRLDPDAVERVRGEATPDVRGPDELHDVLLSLIAARPRREWSEHFEVLANAGRCFEIHRPGRRSVLWAATERRGQIEALFPGARSVPDHRLPPGPADELDAPFDEAAVTLVRGHLDVCGPVTADELAAATSLSRSSVTIALEALRARGFAVSGRFEPERAEQWCARRLLARIHDYTRERRRAEARPVSQEEWQRFLQSWRHATPGTRLQGRTGLAEVIEQLQGSEWPAGEWERLLAARVESYRPEWLDDLCLSGEVAWGRVSVLEPAGEPAAGDARHSSKTPSRRTPITFMLRQDLPWLLQAHRGTVAPAEPTSGPGREVLDALRGRGALFHSDLQAITDLLPTEVEEGLWDGVARGLVSADGFNAIRSLLHARTRFARRRPYARPGARGRRGTWRQGVEGRWTLLPPAEPIDDVEELAETVAWQLLLRWGVVFRDIHLKERLAVPWREILWALRRLEARGLIRGGRFVTGVNGEQFAGETAAPLLRHRRAG